MFISELSVLGKSLTLICFDSIPRGSCFKSLLVEIGHHLLALGIARVLEGEHAQGSLFLALIDVSWPTGVDVFLGEATLAELEADLAHGIAALRVEKGKLACARIGIVEVVALLEARDGARDLLLTVALARELLRELGLAVLLAREDVDSSYERRLLQLLRLIGASPSTVSRLLVRPLRVRRRERGCSSSDGELAW